MKLIVRSVFAFLLILITLTLKGQSIFSVGEKVFFKRTNRATFSISLVFSGGTANYDKSNEGIEYFALNWAVKGGIPNVDPVLLSEKLDSLGIEIEVESSLDYSIVTITALKKYWASSFDIFTQMMTNPSLDEVVFDNIKDELSLYAIYNQQDAENKLYQLSIQNLFNDSHYSKIPEGSVNSISKFENTSVSNYLSALKVKQTGFLTVVGDFEEVELEQIKAFAETQFKDRLEFKSEPIKVPESPLLISEEIETNYLRGMIVSPKLSSNEGFPMQLGMGILSSRLFQRIRNAEGLSYSPSSYYVPSAIRNPYSVIRLDTENPSKAMEVIAELIKEILENGFTEKELNNQKVTYLTEKYLSEETTTAQCKSLCYAALRNQLLTSEQLDQKIKDVKVEDIEKVMTKYLKSIYWSFIGNTDLISEELLLKASKIGG
jgi:predicted Zn-dependent peptidase